ncbi:MAG: carboxypeptidase regulatory-like domain-containing protein [Kofleriaceae bacterium]|nr:carboxypeptidase regulatory-like domain-containing protein [Myxococcales bacterium]MCB9562711.1 carboxypeptidase regulatory-like domain-containing protein [Kofleriaceae bacterium]MCB9571030.1 carboxypeptidase regulatory-like domain-containing protein [Kofleriaceae bacterium]
MTRRHLLGLSIVLATILGAACATTPVRTAPFRARPDSVEPGDLRGPFSGRVVDSSGGAPIAGALVYASWSFETGAALPSPAGFEDFTGSTDADGNYRIPRLADAKVPAGARLVDFTLVVYKRGYVAYRSDRRFADLGPRMDFAQRQNQVALERWRDDYSHARHLRYIGGGPAVAALTSWEAEEAIAELSGTKRGPGELVPNMGNGPYLVAAQLLREADIKAQTRYDGAFETGPLGDEPDTAAYSSQHFKALGRPETFDVAVRLWRMTAGDAQERYEELAQSLPGVTRTDEIASRSLRAAEGDIRGVAFLDGPRGLVVLLTCGQGQCASEDDAVALAHKIDDRIEQLWPLKGAP